MSDARARSVWGSGEAYEPYVSRWSRPVAREFLDWLRIPPSSHWLDVGCGTGALSQTILAEAAPASVHGVDPSEGYLAVARRDVRDPRARFSLGDAQRLPAESATYDAIVSGLVLNFVADMTSALSEMRRVAKRGATIALYVWDYAGKMELMRYFWDAAAELRPESCELDEGLRFPICRPEPLRELFPAPDYAMSLTEDDRVALRERLRSTIPTDADGRIRMIARAWAVRGSVASARSR